MEVATAFRRKRPGDRRFSSVRRATDQDHVVFRHNRFLGLLPHDAPPADSPQVVLSLTDMRFCCACNLLSASEAREPGVSRDSSNRLLERAAVQPTLIRYTMAYTDG